MEEVKLSICNPKPKKLPGPTLLHELVPRSGHEGAAAIEHTSDDGSTTTIHYGHFHDRADALARRIVSKLGHATKHSKRLIIPILIPQCPDLYISQLATLKAGAAFCPLVLDVPEERLRFIVKDVEARLLLTTSAFRQQLPDLEGVHILAVDDDCTSNGNLANLDEVDASITPHDAAYIMYTSGSTGQPKGVILSHSAATQALLAHDSHIPKFSRFLQFASPTFDVSVFEIFFPWLRGRTLISVDRRRLLNDLPAAINELKIDACELTPSVASSLLRGRASVPSLKVLLTIGEMLKPSVVESFGGNEEEPAILHGMYGPTEATIHCTLHTYFPKNMSCGSIGVPLDTVSAFVIRPQDGDAHPGKSFGVEILPLGDEGELAVGGFQIADGYLNRDEQTRTVFIQHPEYGLLYRTGDRARMMPDGRLECLGRISNGQVKLRGQRIELGEIEHAASRTPGCRDVVAEVLGGTLVVFCVRSSGELEGKSVRETCQKWLPAFMVPGHIVLLDGLPYLASGKCDRKALRTQYERDQQRAQPSRDAEASQNTMKVIDVLRKVLRVEVHAASQLATLGLDSLSAIRVASEIRKSGSPQLDAGRILGSRTPKDIADMLELGHDSDADDWQDMAEQSYRAEIDKSLRTTLSATGFENIETAFPCTPVQTAMLTETDKDPGAYCNWVELRTTNTDLTSVQTAVQRLADLHPMLRAGFISMTGPRWSFATIVWKSMDSDQIRQVERFTYDFRVAQRRDLLRACSIQLMSKNGYSHILLRMHHALFDQWAIDLLRVDLCRLLRGERPSLPASFKQVADYYAYNLDTTHSAAAIEFWQEHLRDVIPSSLPLLRGQGAPNTLQRTEWTKMSCQATTVRRKAQAFGCSSPAIFQTATAIVLSSYIGSADLTFGSVFSGRTVPVHGIDGIFGPCLATLPLRIDCNTASTCRDLLIAVTEVNRAMQHHSLVSPTAIRQAAGVAPGSTLFDSLFVWQETDVPMDLANEIQLVDSQDRLEFKLILEFEPSPAGVRARATFQQSLMDAQQAELLLQQIDFVSTAFLEQPDLAVDDLFDRVPLDMLSISNPEPVSSAHGFEIPDVIASRVASEPSAVAILFAKSLNPGHPEFTSITYAELDTRANQMAHRYIAAGLQSEGLVCICMEKCIDLYIAMLASFKAGAGYLPIVPETPMSRIKSVVTQANVSLCVCDADTASVFHEVTKTKILKVDDMMLADLPQTKPHVKQVGARTAYAVFTSGSTGEPKGVPVTMDNLKGNLAVLGELYDVQSGDRLLQSCSQAFDVSVFEIFFAFYSGMCLCSATKDVMFRDFEHSIRSLHATHLSLTPTVAAMVDPKNVPEVRFLVTAGEGITEKVHRLWAGHGLHQGYGPSETTNICSIRMNLSPWDVLGNIGPPFRNTSAFVLAPEGDFRILPSGAYGEFAFGGEQVFRGYMGRDDLNKIKIINHPKHGRIYRSGDMGRILRDGTLLIAGRLDDQVKIRGNRVELGEINSIISDHPEVHDCTTLVIGEGSLTQMLTTFWVPAAVHDTSEAAIALVQSASGLASQLFDRIEDSVPAYMVPSFLIPLNRLPITAQGKLDKRLLRATFDGMETTMKTTFSRSQESGIEDKPTTEKERSIAAALAETLHIPAEHIARNSSFFALGINSLNAIQLARSLEQSLKATISVATILRHSSVARLSRVLSYEDNVIEASSIDVRNVFQVNSMEKIRSSYSDRGLSIETVLPCTPLQQAMLSANASQKSGAYCNTTKLSVFGDVHRLQNCWYQMTQRHAILRTSFTETTMAAHPYVQVVLKDPPLSWFDKKILGLPNAGSDDRANGHAKGESNEHTVHRTAMPPVTPNAPFRIDQDGPDLFLHMHHAIYDGISVSILFEELQMAYRGDRLPPSVSFDPFLEQVLAQNGEEAVNFWSSRMQGFQPHPLPVREEAKGTRETVYEREILVKPADISAFCERHSCTSLVVFQSAWVKTLASLQDVADVCFGNVVSGRSVSVHDIDRLVAPCFNTIPLRIRLDRIRTNLDLIRDLQKTNVETLSYQLTAAQRIQALSSLPAVHLFDSLLLVQPPRAEADLWSLEGDEMDMGIPLVMEITPRIDRFELLVHYLPEKVPESVVPTIADAFVASLKSCLRYPASPIRHFLDFDGYRILGKLTPPCLGSAVDNDGSDNSNESHDWNSTESLVRQVFSELASIDVSHIGRKTSLYQIGLDSLNAVQVASRLREKNLQIDAADIMQYQSPAAVATFVEARQTENSRPTGTSIDLAAYDREHRTNLCNALGLQDCSLEAIRPCTPVQSGMVAQFLQSSGEYYFNHSEYDIPLAFSFNDIKTAWARLERKHKVLRMGFQQMEDAALPFAMLIYHPDVFLDRVFSLSDRFDSDTVKDRASKEVFGALHLPAWRVSLTLSGRARRMCLSMHHALYDADSLHILMSDFAKALRSVDIGPTIDIDPQISMQLESSKQHVGEREKFWTEALRSAQLIKFPNLSSTVVKQSGAYSLKISSTVDMCKFDQFCRAQGSTVQAVGQTAWAILLAAYLGEPAVTFGTVFSGTTSHALQPPSFPTISTVPVRCNTSKKTMEIVQDMVSYNASAYRHRFAPLADIQRYAGSAGQALFDTIFICQKSNAESGERFDWTSAGGSLGIDYVVSLEMEMPFSTEMSLRLTYDTTYIPEDHAKLLLAQYDMILKGIVSGERPHLSRDNRIMSYTSPKEDSLACSVGLLHEFVERGAEQHPSKPALEFIHTFEGGEKSRKRWSYIQLEERANQVAHLITQYGVKPGGVVAVCMSKTAEASFAFVGILKAGCSFLAMDPDLPIARRTFIVEDSKAQLLFVDNGKTDNEMARVVTNIELTEARVLDLPTVRVKIDPIDPGATSYCLYTSGTTGQPKGCELTHENAVQAMMAFQRLFAGHWTEASRWLQFASYWFDVSVLEQFWSWSVGITVVGAPRDLVLEDLAGFIRKANITHIDLTPSLAKLLTPEEVPSLWNHVFITGGEALKQDIIDRWGPYKTICNGYGPTEATIGVTMNPFIGPDAKPSNIGPAFDNVGAYVFTPGTDEIVMRGAVGELCVSGKLVGKGYLNRSDLTARAFPYLERHGERVYRTGDLVRLLANGSLSFIGRADTQAKLRGQRLEIDEIDAVIKSSSEAVSDVASLVLKSQGGSGEMLISFLIAEGSKSRELQLSKSGHSSELVRLADQACRDHLPGYMVPTHIIPLSLLPLTVNNKVDTKCLSAFFQGLTNNDLQHFKGAQLSCRALRPPEQKVADLLGRLLSFSTGEITPSSNLFSLGLSSVSAISFATLLKRNGFKSVNVARIMSNPTIERLAKAVSGDSQDDQEYKNGIRQSQLAVSAFALKYRGMLAHAMHIDSAEIEALAPCTPLQEGLLTESLKSSRRPYFNHFWYDLSRADVSKLEAALRRLVQSIPVLRTSFVRTDEGFAQVVLRERKSLLDILDIEHDGLEELLREQRVRWAKEADHDVERPFEMLIVRSPKRAFLSLHAHHAIYDGISWDLTITRLRELYRGNTNIDSGPSFLDCLPYGPLCHRSDATSFWQTRMRSVPFVPLATRSRSAQERSLSVQICLENSQHLESVRRHIGVSHQALLQAAFTVAIHQYSPHARTYGVVLSGRSIAYDNAENIIGPTFNTVPYILSISQSDNWKQYLQRCHQGNAEVVPFQHTPLRNIRKACGRHPSDPMFDILFVFQQPDGGDVSEEDVLLKPINEAVPAEYPLAIEAEMDASGNVSITVAAQDMYATEADLYDIIAAFQKAVDCMIEDTEQQIADNFEIVENSTTVQQQDHNQDMSQLDGVVDFEWTKEALLLRTEIAQVACCDESEVTEHVAVFSLGLDSIDAVKLASRLKKGSLSIPVSKILQAQTIPRMLGAIETITNEAQPVSSSHLSSLEQQLQAVRKTFDVDLNSSVERVLPAAPGQEALIADMLKSDFRDYYNSDVLHVGEDTDLALLKEAWQSVVDASPILRTSFIEVSDPGIDVVFAQVVHKSTKVNIPEISYATMDELEQHLERVREDVKDSYSRLPPLRLSMATIGSDHFLILSLAHAQYDGHSLALLHEDVAKAYQGRLKTRPPYDDVVELALNAATESSLDFWRSTLTGAKVTRFTEAKENVDQRTHYRERTSAISAPEARSLCQRLGVSLQTLAQTAWALLLAHYTQELEVLFGVVLACRDSEEAEEVMFPTMCTVPTRVILHGNAADMLRYVQSTSNAMRSYQRTPLRAIQKACSRVIELPNHSSGLFDTLFTYQHRVHAGENRHAPLYASVDGSASVEYPVAMEVEVVEQDLVIRASCKSHALDERGADTLIRKYDHALDFLLNSTDREVMDFSGDRVSICGLPSFLLHSESQSTQADGVSQADNRGETEDDDDSPIMASIRTALAQVAKINDHEVSSDSTLDSLGIDSISAIKVTALLRKQSIRLSVSNVLKDQTPRRMARTIRKSISLPQSSSVISKGLIATVLKNTSLPDLAKHASLDSGSIETVMPATPGQTYMLSLWHRSGGELFCPTFSYNLATSASIDELRKAWSKVTCHTPILRTIFVAIDGEFAVLQVVLKTSPPNFFVGPEAADLSSQPMVALQVQQTNAGFELRLTMQHALYDAVSLPLIMRNLRAAIDGQDLSSPNISFEDFVALPLKPEARTSRESFWHTYLSDVQPLRLRQASASATRKVQVFRPRSFGSCVELEERARAARIGVQALLFAIYAKIYASRSEASSAKDVVLGIYHANRSHLSELERLAAPTLNLLPLLVRKPMETDLMDSAKQIDQDLRLIGQVENSVASLHEIWRWTGVTVDTFVNFLKLPEAVEEEASPATNGATIKPADDEWSSSISRVAEAHKKEVGWLPQSLRNFLPGDAYEHAVDVEVSIDKEDLSIGFFCFEEMFDLKAAEDIVADVISELEMLVN